MQQIKINDPSLLFFTSDHHFGHANVIKHCSRPYSSVEEMDTDLIKRWNEKIPKNGMVIHGGDLSMNLSKGELYAKYLKHLNGKIIFQVIGNHDRKLENHLYNNKPKNDSFGDKCLITVKDPGFEYGYKKIVVNHFPELSWYHKEKGAWHVFGHVHGNLIHPHKNAVDITIDANDYYPISYSELKSKILARHLAL